MAKPGVSRMKFRRLSISVNMNLPSSPSTASLPTITVWNTDSGGNIWNGQIKDIANLFRNLGFDTVSSYSPPVIT
jgi:hypothetical protein